MKKHLLKSAVPQTKNEATHLSSKSIAVSDEPGLIYNGTLMDIIRDAVVVMDKDFRIISWYRGAEEMYGWKENEVIGKVMYDLLQTEIPFSTWEKIKEDLTQKGYFREELIHKTKSGETINVFASTSSIPDDKGAPSGMIAIIKNITGRKKAETKLAYHAALMESIKDAVMSLDKNMVIKSWNKGAEEMYGWTEEEAIGKKVYEFLQTDFQSGSLNETVEIFQKQGYFQGELLHKKKNGEVINVLLSASAIYDANGSICGMLGLTKNITEDKKREALLKDFNQHLTEEVRIKTKELTKIYDRVTDAFTALDKNWNYTYMNKKAGEIFHCDPEKMIGRHIWTEFPESIGRQFHRSCLKAMETQQYIYDEDFYQHADNWLGFNIYPSTEGVSIYFRDITENKRNAEKLNKANRLYQFISQINQMIVHTSDEEAVFKEACKIAIEIGKFKMAWVGLLNEKTKIVEPVMFDGLDQDYLINIRIISDKTKPEGRGPSGTAIQENRFVVCNDIETDPMMILWREEGLKRNYRSMISLPIRKFGRVIGTYTLYSDTKYFFDPEEIFLLEEVAANISFSLETIEKDFLKKIAEESVITSERKYHILTEAAPVGIFHADHNSNIIYVNPRWTYITGLSNEKTLGQGWVDAIYPDDKAKIIAYWNTASNKNEQLKFEFRFVHPNGSIVWVITQVVPEKDSTNQITGYVGTITDITNLKNAENIKKKSIEQLKLSQKIAHIGYWEIDLVNKDNYWSEEMYHLCEMENTGTAIKKDQFILKIHADDKKTVLDKLKSIYINKQKSVSVEFRFIMKDGSIKYMLVTGQLIIDAQGNPKRINGTMQDITNLKNVQFEIFKEKHLSDSIINSLPGVFYLFNREGKFLRWNKNLETVSQYSSVEISEMLPLDFIDEDDKEAVRNMIAKTFESGEENIIAHMVNRSKEKIPFYFTGIAEVYEGEPYIMGIGVDYSERIKIQEKIKKSSEQLQELTAHLQTIREEERKRIGRELHDELGQQLTAVKMDVAWINKKIPDEPPIIKEKLKNILELIDGSNASLRRILNELRPTILDEHGLKDAINALATQFTNSTGIPVKLIIDKKDIKVSEQIATCIYRVFQEALTNIRRYSEAKKVVFFMEISDAEIVITIEDDGKGFDSTTEQPKTRKPFGILGMKERVRALKGEFDILSDIGKGTKIYISLPLTF